MPNAGQSGQSSKDPIDIINEWWQKYLQNHESESESINQLHTRFVKSALEPLQEKLGIGKRQYPLVTVRLSFCFSRRYIRPVYSDPMELSEYFRDPNNQKPFDLESKGSFKNISVVSPPVVKNNLRHSASFAGWSSLNFGTTQLTGFSERISDFVENGKTSEFNLIRRRLKNATHCFFAGRTKEQKKLNQLNYHKDLRIPNQDASKKKTNGRIQISHMLAIYYKHTKAFLTEADVEALRSHTEKLFLGLDLIARIDAMLFKTEGLQLVAELMPEFARNDVAHADKIAYALERLRTLFTRHMIGRHGGGESTNENEPSCIEPPKKPEIFYLAATFEKSDKGKVTPRLELYPHVYRTLRDYYKVAFLVSHQAIPTATKFLLWRYMTSKDFEIIALSSEALHAPKKSETEVVVIDSKYKKLFSTAIQKGPELSDVNPKPDFLSLSKNENEQFWKDLQKDAKSDTRSLAAFVVEGKTVESNVGGPISRNNKRARYLPRGIFAIESPYEDGFSDDDIESLRIIFQGVASLVRSISHHHAPIDYRTQIASTFQEEASEDHGDYAMPRLTTLLFYTQKMDARVFTDLVNDWPIYIREDKKLLLKKIATEIEVTEGVPPREERNRILSNRMTTIQRIVEDHPGDVSEDDFLSDEVLQFLDACPENFTWASYMRCMAQTLGERMKPQAQIPNFKRLKPGFSASGMFMANVAGELRQVVKLSSAEKVDREADHYRKYVRYRLVNAARIPSSAVDFETTGKYGRESGEAKKKMIDVTFEAVMEEADGILVSDLVSGEVASERYNESSEIYTLLDAVVHCLSPVVEEGHKNSLPDRDVLEDALEAVFVKNAVLWSDHEQVLKDKLREEGKTSLHVPDRITEIQNAFRIHPSEIDEYLERLSKVVKSRSELTFDYGDLKKTWNTRNRVNDAINETWRIIHGDMNVRNLTWSDALETFFLIDFEFTGPGLLGCDQFRLIVNLIAEVWNAFGAANTHGFDIVTREPFFVAEMNNAVDYLVNVFKELMHKEGKQSLEYLAITQLRNMGVKEDTTAEECNARLASIIARVLATIRFSDRKLRAAENWRSHWALIMFIAAVKEFTYTCRRADDSMLDEKLIEELLEGTPIDAEGLLETLAERVESVVERHKIFKTNDDRLRHDLQRNVLVGRLLAKLITVLSEVKGT